MLQVERLREKRKTRGFHFGKIKHVIDDDQQRLRRVIYRVDEQFLFVIKLCVAQQIGHADDAVHGGSDLVRHIGEKGRLGAVGCFRFALGHLNLAPMCDGFGNVDDK